MQFVKVKSLTKISDMKIYYLNVDNNHNFFGNHICLHNCDYYNNPKNEGEIFIRLHNQGTKTLKILRDESFAQGIFAKFLLIDGDSLDNGNTREGGLGSTTGKV